VFSNVMLKTRIVPVLKIVIIKIINIRFKNGQKHYKVTKAVDIHNRKQ
jgi:hypothetical protein